MKYGLIGERLGHSFSRELHNALGRYEYELMELSPRELPGFFAAREFQGINVTVPYKQAVIPYLDGLTPAAEAIGAVNTVVNRNGKLYGGNTDLGGLTALLRRAGISLSGKKVLILGTGGTSRTAMAAADRAGAGQILRVSRTSGPDRITYAQAKRDHRDAEVILNTTPVGMYPALEAQPLELSCFDRLEGVADVIYNPLRSRLVLEAFEREIPAAGGLYMLVRQAVLACEAFTGAPVSEDTAEGVYRDLLRQKRNIVLIGMPGAGKSVQGRNLSEKLGLPFYDTDTELTRRTGRTPAELIRDRGEAAFRELESQVIRDLAQTGGKVIATGGGAVLRAENVRRLRQNGITVYLDRPLSTMKVTGDRPLSDSREKLEALYRIRAPLYRGAADRILPVTGTKYETMTALEALFV